MAARPVLLDSSFLIALERETRSREIGPARRFLPRLKGRKVVVSVVSVEEILEGVADEAAALNALRRFSIQGLHVDHATRCARIQRKSKRRMGENDAWIAATAEAIDADVVGADRNAFSRLRERYLKFR